MRKVFSGRSIFGDWFGRRFHRSVEFHNWQNTQRPKIPSPGKLYDDGRRSVVLVLQSGFRNACNGRARRQNQSLENTDWTMSEEVRESAQQGHYVHIVFERLEPTADGLVRSSHQVCLFFSNSS
jgi:hypothetical protein